MDETRGWFRYMPISPEAKAWGAYTRTGGFAVALPGAPYPPRQHPKDHHFRWETGRVLHSYCFVYITRGEGTFDARPGGRQLVRAGDLLVLFPEVWHRYRPLDHTGWEEYWLEFDGDYIRHLMIRREFEPAHPVLHVGLRENILELFLQSIQLLRQEPPEYQSLLGTLATQIIARALSALKERRDQQRPVHELIREAKQLLVGRPMRKKNLEAVARRLNMSYSSFRRLFRAETGFSPGQFALETQLQRASEMLVHTDIRCGEIAEQCGFESVYYFSRVFRKKRGQTPTAFRKAALWRLRRHSAADEVKKDK
jgi:AraC-like DNA-binding protein